MPNKNNSYDSTLPDLSEFLERTILASVDYARMRRFQFVTPELVILVLCYDDRLCRLMSSAGVDSIDVEYDMENYLDSIDKVPHNNFYLPVQSAKYRDMISRLFSIKKKGSVKHITMGDLFATLCGMTDIEGAKRLRLRFGTEDVLLKVAERYCKICDADGDDYPADDPYEHVLGVSLDGSPEADNGGYDDFKGLTGAFDDAPPLQPIPPAAKGFRSLDDELEDKEVPFVGRDTELLKTAITLSKEERNNVVFVGDRGVGKTAMIRGLFRYCKKLRKKSLLGSARFFEFRPSEVMAGATYVDEVDVQLRNMMKIASNAHEYGQEAISVIFVDNISELMPMGQNDQTPDTLRMLMSMARGTCVRLVTTASYEQYKRFSTYNASVCKNFARIDIAEPPLDPDCANILEAYSNSRLKRQGTGFLGPVHRKAILEIASTTYAKDLSMPGRAIDLLDAVLAYKSIMSAKKGKSSEPFDLHKLPVVTDCDIEGLMKAMGFDGIVNKVDGENALRGLEPNMLAKIFGQDEAVHGVAQSVLLAKAGLSDDTKPLAAYLFVGPTGVGKTELAKVLAAELGTKLVRFDMSEYSEQHTVSKLVGSPAGYIGYDDGGLLTDAVRKTPNCVLLFDEIEKAHSAVFNLLLQVLDYAQLTDNKGQKADFSGTIIIMTSNAGARFATGVGLGFGAKSEKSEVMGAELKKTFAPEFLNRLTSVVAFHDMSEPMAQRILDRKLGELADTLKRKKEVSFELTDAAKALLLKAGFSKSYGAREMDRAIGSLLKPALMQRLLFEGVKDKEVLRVDVEEDKLKVLPPVKASSSKRKARAQSEGEE